ncbi:PepSY-associated TM helix domain-containing protein [Chitinophaga cymbidii]|uniref:PepSY domain-containing protein n=1 Tax=Chitinophaga cymbidii TaxID=1096750 RepID=A0A512RQP6_9BACT|nr:PepSY-associated TM helix domain-containing protein [Chitinophaga cymbidii]GEP98019.1 hypothetical protein CCY01nite_42790 [Chitinophaga cymbidii]
MGFLRSLRPRWAKHQQRWFGKWHVYLGIIAGAIVAFVGVTGSILVFQDEIDRAMNPELFYVMEQEEKMPIEEIVPIIRKKYPDLHFDYISNDVENKPNLAYRLFNFKTEEEFFINPYTVELSGKRLHESTFIHIVTELHRNLLVPAVGRYIVGLATLCLLILTISGLRLWIPQKWKYLKEVLTVKFSAGFKRQNYDWHNVLGFYSAPVVSLLSITGICFTFSPLVIALLFLLDGQSPQGVAQLLGARSTYTENAKPLPLKAIVAIGSKVMPDGKIAGVSLPVDSTGNYRLDILGKNVQHNGKREMLIIDQYSGKILLNSRHDFPESGDAYLGWLASLHYGSFGGRPTQIVALIGGLMPLVLFVTGFIIWWPRYRKQRRNGYRPISTIAGGVASKSFAVNMRAGFRYALWFVPVSAVMGALYGLFSGIVLQPAVFAIVYTAVFVMLNFVVALTVWCFNLIFLMPFRKGSHLVQRYFALSLSFAIVFIICYLLLMNTGINIF